MAAYDNEIDKGAAAWRRELIAQELIAEGDVDERDIRDVQPGELRGYTQCHFFAGIGGWSHALRLAGWPDDRPVWTSSCPCQPFSSAGKRGGVADERHLWPELFRLIGERRPPLVFGEQVASATGLGWWDLVQADLEGAGYAAGAAAWKHSRPSPTSRLTLSSWIYRCPAYPVSKSSKPSPWLRARRWSFSRRMTSTPSRLSRWKP